MKIRLINLTGLISDYVTYCETLFLRRTPVISSMRVFNSWLCRLLYSPFHLARPRILLRIFLSLVSNFSVKSLLFIVTHSVTYRASGHINWTIVCCLGIYGYCSFVIHTFNQVVGHFRLVDQYLRASFSEMLGSLSQQFLNFSVLLIFSCYTSSSLGVGFILVMNSVFSKEIWRPTFAACALSWLIHFGAVSK